MFFHFSVNPRSMKDELAEWMDSRSVSAEALSKRLGVKMQTIYNWRSAGVPARKQDHLRRVMNQWDLHPDSQGQAFIVRPTADQFREWNRAALERGELVEDWALRSLDELAAEELAESDKRPQLKVAETPPEYRAKRGNGSGE